MAIHFSFKTTDQELITKVRNYKNLGFDSQSALLTTAVKNYFEPKQSTDIDEKIKKAKLLQLNLKNWELLKQSNHIFEESKAMVLGHKELAAPEFIPTDTKPAAPHRLNNTYCLDCKHYHADNKPAVCKNMYCNCGVRF